LALVPLVLIGGLQADDHPLGDLIEKLAAASILGDVHESERIVADLIGSDAGPLF
jgi:hypothetical protein